MAEGPHMRTLTAHTGAAFEAGEIAGTNRMYIYRTHTYVCIAAGVAETRETPLGMLRLQGVRGGPAEA